MWPGFDPTVYPTREEYQQHVESLPHLPWVRFLVAHNTGSPSLAQWVDGGVSEQQRLINLEHYYEVTEGWHSGPHGFISPTHITGFADPTKPGVHASCFNAASLGFELVGDYSADSFTTGDGARVRDNAVFCLAVWYRKLGLRPDGFRYGISGLHFHKDCLRDHHDCPGRNVDRMDLVVRVLDQMAALGGAAVPPLPTPPLPPAPAPAVAPAPLSAYLRRGSRGSAVEELQKLLGVDADGIFGSGTETAVESFQKSQGARRLPTVNTLVVDGVVGPLTLAALKRSRQEKSA